jgi:hypothetical protein
MILSKIIIMEETANYIKYTNISEPKTFVTHQNYEDIYGIIIVPHLNGLKVRYGNVDKENEECRIISSVFIGKSPDCRMTRFAGSVNFKECSSVLFELSPCKYMFICDEIVIFDTESEIVDFCSPIGNNRVCYPYAKDKKDQYYLLSENVILSDFTFSSKYDNPYNYYYDVIRITPQEYYDDDDNDDGNESMDRYRIEKSFLMSAWKFFNGPKVETRKKGKSPHPKMQKILKEHNYDIQKFYESFIEETGEKCYMNYDLTIDISMENYTSNDMIILDSDSVLRQFNLNDLRKLTEIVTTELGIKQIVQKNIQSTLSNEDITQDIAEES